MNSVSTVECAVLEDLVNELDSGSLVLPTLPEVALQVRDAVARENVTTSELVKIINMDAALIARLMRVVNSPLMRGARKIDSLDQAINRMGHRMLRNLVNSIIMQQMFQATTDETDKRFRQLWAHSTEVGAIAHSLAAFVKLSPDQALLAGLVHDIGTLPILKKAEDYPELLHDAAALDRVINNLHTRIGAAILEDWGFDEGIVKVAAEHEDLARSGGEKADYVDIVIVANLQSHMGTDHALASTDWSAVPAFAKLGFSTEVYEVEMENESEKIAEIQAALNG